MNLAEAATAFRSEMLEKFYARHAKNAANGGKSVVDTPITEIDVKDLRVHFYDEVAEFENALEGAEERDEAVDVANMAFLIWWHSQESGP